jgi:protein-S-isoprenylcysteine O-methyltransferase Ste14
MNYQLKLLKSRIFEILGNVLVVFLYLNFVVLYLSSFSKTHNISILLYALYSTVILLMLFVRKQADATSDNLWFWLAAVGGTFADLLMRPYPTNNSSSLWIIPQCIGILISLFGVLSLNRGFGIMVGNRGIHTDGMYRYIRHPLYAGYLLTSFSFLVQHISPWNVMIFVSFLVLQIIRIHIEETFLASDPKYVKYIRYTKWRLVPGLW